MNSPIDLLFQCPFCGKQAEARQRPDKWWAVGCTNVRCWRPTVIIPDRDNAIKQWNTRV